MQELFRIEAPVVTVRWASVQASPQRLEDGEVPEVTTAGTFECRVIYPTGSPPRLLEQQTYRLSIRAHSSTAVVKLIHRDAELVAGITAVEELGSNVLVGTLNFRNQVGESRFEVWVDGRFILSFVVEVFPSKFDYRHDFEQLLAEVQDILTALAFEYLTATHSGARHEHAQPTGLEWALLLRSVIDELEWGLLHVSRHPIRSLRREEQLVRAEQVRRPDATVLRAIRTGKGRGGFFELREGVRVAAQLPTLRAELTLDTLEHRWLAEHLTRTWRRLVQLIQAESNVTVSSARHTLALKELRALESRLERLRRLEPLMAATAPPPASFASLQLSGAPGYREAARAIITLQLALRLEGNALELSLKDISTLYEYWCFLAVLRFLREKTGSVMDLTQLIQPSTHGLQVVLKKGSTRSIVLNAAGARSVLLEYNPQYRNYVLMAQKPDIVIVLREAGHPLIRIVLDAKYRVDPNRDYGSSAPSLENAMPSSEKDRLSRPMKVMGPPEDAINVLHRYRDAILTEEPTAEEGRRVARSVVYAAALYPATVTPEDFRSSRLSHQLKAFGVGAVPFLPSNRALLEGWLEEMLHMDLWSLQTGAQPMASDSWIWRAATEVVLVGVLRNPGTEQHLHWCLQNKCYYISGADTRHGRQTAVRRIVLYVPAHAMPDGVGAILWQGTVVESIVMPRSELSTPWSSSHSSATVRLYRVEYWTRLRAPIQNVESQRFSTHRWTTGLALLRAKKLSELLLESPLEWQLYDRLRAAGWPFELHADDVSAVSSAAHPSKMRGHARFYVGAVSVRYTGVNGFMVWREALDPTYRATVEDVMRYVGKVISPSIHTTPSE